MEYRMITPPPGPVKRLVKVTMPTSRLGRFLLVSYFLLLRIRQRLPWLINRRGLDKIKKFNGAPISNTENPFVF